MKTEYAVAIATFVGIGIGEWRSKPFTRRPSRALML
jgi:hypothetical protein